MNRMSHSFTSYLIEAILRKRDVYIFYSIARTDDATLRSLRAESKLHGVMELQLTTVPRTARQLQLNTSQLDIERDPLEDNS